MIAVVTPDSHTPDHWTAAAGPHAAGGPGPGAALRRLCRVPDVPPGEVLPLPGATADRRRFRLGPAVAWATSAGPGGTPVK